MPAPEETPARAERSGLARGAGRAVSSPGGAFKRPKAACADACHTLEQLPNVGPAMAAQLRRLGITQPQQLAGRDAYTLYLALGRLAGRRQDPCVLDTLLAITDFMQGAAPAPWWHYTARRRQQYGSV